MNSLKRNKNLKKSLIKY